MNPRWRWDHAAQCWRVFYAGQFWWIKPSPDNWKYFLRDIRMIAIVPALTTRPQ
jgi:hypothetical protein